MVHLFCISAAATLAFQAIARADGFIDITHDSGLDQVIDAHYAAIPHWWLSGINLVEVDGSGRLALFLGAHGQHGLIALNDGHGRFTRVDPSVAPYPATELQIACPFTSGGTPNLQMTHDDGGGLWHLNRSRPGHLNWIPAGIAAEQARENAMIDIDRDGLVDWIHEAPGVVVIEHGDGMGNFERAQTIPAFMETSVLPVDLNGDGYIDLVLKECGYYDEQTGKSRILLNDGKGHFQAMTESGVPDAGVVIQGIGDVNGDGLLDLVCLENGKDVAIYLNDGAAHFTKLLGAVSGMDKATRPNAANWGLAAIVDLDNDGTPDILMNGRNFLYVLRGLGGGHFRYMNEFWGIRDRSWATVDEGLCFGDIDGDGALDIVACGGVEGAKRVTVYRNDLPKQNWLNVRAIGKAGNFAAAGAKIRIYAPETSRLLGSEQIVIAARQTAQTCYTFGTTERHFGLGSVQAVDVEVEFYPFGTKAMRRGVIANTTVEVAESGVP